MTSQIQLERQQPVLLPQRMEPTSLANTPSFVPYGNVATNDTTPFNLVDLPNYNGLAPYFVHKLDQAFKGALAPSSSLKA